MQLRETVTMMNSRFYKDRFKAEYFQLKIRYEKLQNMIEEWDRGNLGFIPTCPKRVYKKQLKEMKNYLDTLEERAGILLCSSLILAGQHHGRVVQYFRDTFDFF